MRDPPVRFRERRGRAIFPAYSTRKGASVAVFATARKLAILIYRMLRYGMAYVDEGVQAYEQRFQAARLQLCEQIANQFGYKIIQQESV